MKFLLVLLCLFAVPSYASYSKPAPQEETTIRQIAATTSQTATEARTLLYLRYGEEYPIDLPPLSELIDPALFENVYINFKSDINNVSGLSTAIGKPYPNPAKGGFSIDVNLSKDTQVQLTCFDITGNIQETATLTGNGTFNIATGEWVSGMYYYRIIAEDGSIISGKVAVFK